MENQSTISCLAFVISLWIVPAITVFEVFKWILREHSEAQAIQAIAVMQRGKVVDLDSSIAIVLRSSATLCACPWQTASSSLRGNIRLGSTAWLLTSRALQMLNSF